MGAFRRPQRTSLNYAVPYNSGGMMIHPPERAVLIICPNHFPERKAMLRSHIRYVLIDDERWWDDPTWYQYKLWAYKYPWVKVHAVLAPCQVCERRNDERRLPDLLPALCGPHPHPTLTPS